MARTRNHHDPPGNGADVRALLTYRGPRRSELSIDVVGLFGCNLWIPRRQALMLIIPAAAYEDDGEAREEERGRVTAREVAERYASILNLEAPVKSTAIVEYICSLERRFRLELRGASRFELPPLRLIDARRNAGYRLACRLTVNPPLSEIIP